MHKFILTIIVSFFALSLFGQVSHQTLKWQDKNRKFIVYLPQNYSPEEELPLVINMHPYLTNGTIQMYYSQYNRLADTARCIVVYPSAIGGQWNMGPFFGISNPIDDVGFINYLIDYVSIFLKIDSRRIYATGYSAGGFMSYKLACELSNRIVAIAPVAASMHPDSYSNCNPTRPVPLMPFNSVSDPITLYNGFEGVQPVDDVINLWQDLNGCDIDPIIEDVPNVVQNDNSTAKKISYQNCEASEFVFMKFFNAGHTWPGANPSFLGNTNRDVNATNESWAFFRKFEMPEELSCDKPTNLASETDGNMLFLSWSEIDEIDFYNVIVFYPDGEIETIEDVVGNSLQLEFSEAGTLTWMVRAQCESGHVTWSNVKIEDIGMRVASYENEITVYPNPVVDQVTIMVKDHLLNQKFEIIDGYGKPIYVGFFRNNGLSIDLSFLTSGSYYIVANNGLSQQLFIKQ